jgi:hypothetical protein
MIKGIALIFFIFSGWLLQAQMTYLDLNFEDKNADDNRILKSEYICYKTMLEISRNPEISADGNNCLSIRTWNQTREGCTIYFSLPEDMRKDLKHVRITLKIRYSQSFPNGGFWVFATKGIRYLGKATTYPGYIPYPIIFTYMWRPKWFPVNTYEWYDYDLSFDIDQDPDDLIFGFFVKSGKVWYDDIQLYLNNNPVENLIIEFDE